MYSVLSPPTWHSPCPLATRRLFAWLSLCPNDLLKRKPTSSGRRWMVDGEGEGEKWCWIWTEIYKKLPLLFHPFPELLKIRSFSQRRFGGVGMQWSWGKPRRLAEAQRCCMEAKVRSAAVWGENVEQGISIFFFLSCSLPCCAAPTWLFFIPMVLCSTIFCPLSLQHGCIHSSLLKYWHTLLAHLILRRIQTIAFPHPILPHHSWFSSILFKQEAAHSDFCSFFFCNYTAITSDVSRLSTVIWPGFERCDVLGNSVQFSLHHLAFPTPPRSVTITCSKTQSFLQLKLVWVLLQLQSKIM